MTENQNMDPNQLKIELEIFNEFLETIWMDNSREEAHALWKYINSNSPLYKSRVFAAIEFILKNPPEDLIERMQQKGWIILSHNDPNETLYSFEEHLNWLKEMKDELQLLVS